MRLIYISHLSLLTVPWSSVRLGTKKFTESHRSGPIKKYSRIVTPKTC